MAVPNLLFCACLTGAPCQHHRQGIYGQGQTIAVVEDSDTYGTDVATFQSLLGLSKYGGSMVTLHPEPNGLTNCADPGTPTTGDSASVDHGVTEAHRARIHGGRDEEGRALSCL
ncbi:MAG: hypothetical protein ABSF64_25475 [Bryobacteraceae bacterium]|jgi:hypothetical protein